VFIPLLLALALGGCAESANTTDQSDAAGSRAAKKTQKKPMVNTAPKLVPDGIVAPGLDPKSRIAGAVKKGSKETPHGELLAQVAKFKKGKILVDAASRVKGLPAERVFAGDLFSDPAIEATWWSVDEDAAADVLLAKDIQFVLLRRDVLPSVDRGGYVLGRLYHDDFRTRFELRAVDHHFSLYRVLRAERRFSPQLARVVTDQIRTRLRGDAPAALPSMKSEDGLRWNLVASVRREGGKELAIGMCLRDELRDCVAELARDLEREHRRYAEWYGFPPLSEEIDDMILEVQRVVERSRVLVREDKDLRNVWEMGIDGGIIYDAATKKTAVFPGSVAYARAFKDPARLLKHAAMQFHLASFRPWRDEKNRLEKFRTIHYLDWPGRGFYPMFRGAPPIPMEAVDIESLEDSLLLAAEWYLANMAPNVDLPDNLPYADGQVVYKFWPSENRFSDEYNLVRHTLATWNLVQAWHIDPRPEFLTGARAALDWTLRYRVDEGDMSFIHYNNNRKLGSVVVQLMGMIDLARATGSDEWDDLMNRFGNFTLFMQEESGKFDPYYVPDDHPYADATNDIVPGEALLALVMLYEYTGDEKWIAPTEKYFEYYMPWWNERVIKKSDRGAWPAWIYDNQTRLDLVQFGPWTVMAANAYNRATGDTRYVDFALEVGRWMVESYGWMPGRSPWPDYVGGYYKMPHELPAMQAFCYAEGTAAAYDLALRARPEHAAFFETATRASARFALNMQFDDVSSYPFARSELARGGTRYAMNETKIRIDYVYHAFSSVFQYLEAAKNDPNLPASVRESPLRRAARERQRRDDEGADER